MKKSKTKKQKRKIDWSQKFREKKSKFSEKCLKAEKTKKNNQIKEKLSKTTQILLLKSMQESQEMVFLSIK